MSEYVNLTEVARRIDVPRESLKRLLTEPTGYVAKWAEAKPGTMEIPETRIPYLAAWAERRNDARLKPSALAQSLADGADIDTLLLGERERESDGEISPVTGNRSPVSGEIGRALTPSAIEAVTVIVEQVIARVLPQVTQPMEDELLVAEEVRAIIRGSIPKTLPPVAKSPRRWRRSDVMRWISSL